MITRAGDSFCACNSAGYYYSSGVTCADSVTTSIFAMASSLAGFNADRRGTEGDASSWLSTAARTAFYIVLCIFILGFVAGLIDVVTAMFGKPSVFATLVSGTENGGDGVTPSATTLPPIGHTYECEVSGTFPPDWRPYSAEVQRTIAAAVGSGGTTSKLAAGTVQPRFAYKLHFSSSPAFPEGYQENCETGQRRSLRRVPIPIRPKNITTIPPKKQQLPQQKEKEKQRTAAPSVTRLLKSVSPEEHESVKRKFKLTCRKTISKIEKVHHPALKASYDAYRDFTVAPGNGGDANERQLFHGTDTGTIQKITGGGNQCFDRAYTTTHAYGKGVYFARDASYSANVSYSQPDVGGVQRMFLCRVAVGASTKGRSDMKAPPERCSATHTLYDSTVDSTANPSIFVVYKDAAAYPEYIITFK